MTNSVSDKYLKVFYKRKNIFSDISKSCLKRIPEFFAQIRYPICEI